MLSARRHLVGDAVLGRLSLAQLDSSERHLEPRAKLIRVEASEALVDAVGARTRSFVAGMCVEGPTCHVRGVGLAGTVVRHLAWAPSIGGLLWPGAVSPT